MEDILIPIFICVVLPVLIVFFCCYYSYKSRKARLDTLAKAIEKGVEIDPSLLTDPEKSTTEKKEKPMVLFTWGMVLSLVGIALLLIGLLPNSNNLAGVSIYGIIPLAIGIGLIIAFFAGRYFKKKDAVKE